jgi:hypothetical protein
LVYAVGTVKNDTARQRFGVKIELDLIDAQDNKIGSASDYIEVLEPGKEWQFNSKSPVLAIFSSFLFPFEIIAEPLI